MSSNYGLLAPEFILFGTAMIVVLLDAFRAQWKVTSTLLAAAAALGALGALAASLAYMGTNEKFGELLVINNFTMFFRVLFNATVVIVIAGSYEFVNKNIRHPGEFYALLLLSTIGATYMAAANELLTAYLSIEVLSFSLYVAVSLAKSDPRSGEAGLKYVLLGGVASAMLLYGLSLIYGATGQTSYEAIRLAFEEHHETSAMVLAGLALAIGGLAFKASAVPFHMWTPDAYEGAPLPITAYLSATSKAATFALLLRLLTGPLAPLGHDWGWMFATLSVTTMVVGNLVALQQNNIKRLLAYSSIGQVGFMLMSLTVLSSDSLELRSSASSALLLHMAGYLITNLAVFTAVIAFHNRTGKEEIAEFRGLAETQPFLALVITAGLFSLSGMPLLAGFATKFILFQAAASGGYLWLAGLAVIMSTVSLYYYLQVVKQFYFYPPVGDTSRWRLSPVSYILSGVLLVAMVGVGLYFGPLYEVAEMASNALYATHS
ncbi:MAG: NADH-quinone oxidoreductase subunit N [Dehalococcoidia bacterium]|nr:NADH-quinone oxidoreductase subunit N [Dehalococcoidia bacterium]